MAARGRDAMLRAARAKKREWCTACRNQVGREGVYKYDYVGEGARKERRLYGELEFYFVKLKLKRTPVLKGWDAVLQARALFVLLLSTLLCSQPIEVILGFFVS